MNRFAQTIPPAPGQGFRQRPAKRVTSVTPRRRVSAGEMHIFGMGVAARAAGCARRLTAA